jgi:hypothetical protein
MRRSTEGGSAGAGVKTVLDLLTGGRLSGLNLADLILAGVVLEASVLLMYRRRTGRGIAPAALITNLLAGAGLLLALRWSLSVDRPRAGILAGLTLAMVAHVADLALRWQRRA